jgi:hypothetical protein
MPGLTMFSAMRPQVDYVGTNSIDSKTITLVSPLGEGGLYAAQTVCVGFLPFPGKGARAFMRGYYENDPRNTRKTQKKSKKNQCNLCNLWFHLFNWWATWRKARIRRLDMLRVIDEILL